MSTIRCEKCKNIAQPEDRFCRTCGFPLAPKPVITGTVESLEPKRSLRTSTKKQMSVLISVCIGAFLLIVFLGRIFLLREFRLCEGNKPIAWSKFTLPFFWGLKFQDQKLEYSDMVERIKNGEINEVHLGSDGPYEVLTAELPIEKRYLARCGSSIFVYRGAHREYKIVFPIDRLGNEVYAFEYYDHVENVDRDCQPTMERDWYYCNYFVEY